MPVPAITHAKVSTRIDDADTDLVRPSDWNASHVGSDEWGSIISKSGDQSVTNSSTLTDATELQVSVGAGEIWMFQVILLYSGTSASGDFKWAFAVAGGNMTGWHRYTISDTTADGINASTGVRSSALATTTAVACGTDAAGTIRMGFIEAMFRFSAATTIKLQFAQNVQTGSTSATIRAGTELRARKMI